MDSAGITDFKFGAVLMILLTSGQWTLSIIFANFLYFCTEIGKAHVILKLTELDPGLMCLNHNKQSGIPEKVISGG